MENATGEDGKPGVGPVTMFGKPVELVYESPEPVTIQLPTIGKSCRVMICTVRDKRGKP